MFNLTYTSPYEGEIKTLKLKEDPLYYGLGHYEDVDGNLWDIHCVFGNNGKPVVNARLVDDSSLYATVHIGCDGHWSWLPYYLEVVKEK
jgi:hypothetical protein